MRTRRVSPSGQSCLQPALRLGRGRDGRRGTREDEEHAVALRVDLPGRPAPRTSRAGSAGSRPARRPSPPRAPAAGASTLDVREQEGDRAAGLAHVEKRMTSIGAMRAGGDHDARRAARGRELPEPKVGEGEVLVEVECVPLQPGGYHDRGEAPSTAAIRRCRTCRARRRSGSAWTRASASGSAAASRAGLRSGSPLLRRRCRLCPRAPIRRSQAPPASPG